MIIQYISPWVNGERTTFQFFGHVRQLWIIRHDNIGRLIYHCEHELGDAYETTLQAADKMGLEKYEHQIARKPRDLIEPSCAEGSIEFSTNQPTTTMTTDSISNYRVTRGYTTSAGDGDDEHIAFFATRREAIAAARAEVSTLRITNRNGLVITDEVLVEELDQDGEPVDQPIFWVTADREVAS